MIIDNQVFIKNFKYRVETKFNGNASEYCRRAGIPRSTLRILFIGCSPRADVLFKLARAAGNTMDEIYHESLEGK